MGEKEAVLSVRVPTRFKELIVRFVKLDGHMNESDLVRNAVRDYIKGNAPSLYEELFDNAALKEKDNI